MGKAVSAIPPRTGEATIDAEHDVQLQLLDSLSEILNREEGIAAGSLILDQFIEFSDMHFLSEQLVMRLHGYPGYEPHLEEHTRLMKKVREIRDHVQRGEQRISQQLILELRNWLITHIASEDVAFGEYLGKKVGNPS